MLSDQKSITIDRPEFWLLTFPNFVTSRQRVCEMLEKQSLQPLSDRLRKLLARGSSPISEIVGLLCHVIVVNVEHHMLPQFSLSRVAPDVDGQSSRHHDVTGGKEEI